MSDQRPERDTSVIRSNPNRPWVCGHAELGLCCPSGPSDSGQCGRSLSAPQTCKQQSEETISKSFIHESSTCEPLDAGSMPTCVPRRAIGYSRRLWALNAGILTGACLLFLMVIPGRESIFVPGELSRKHAQILQNKVVADRCSLCHPSSHSAVLSPSSSSTQDALCLRCHESHLVDAGLGSPHDISKESVLALSQDTRDRLIASGKLVSVKTNIQHWLENGTSCSVCHVEHHGREFDLKHMDNARCQTCHQQQFSSLSSGHPEFQDFPYQRTRRIAFDHRAHEAKHFPQKNQEFDCRQCHLDRSREGVVGPIFRTLGFDVACAKCHDEPIRSATTNGWAMIQLPSVEQADTENAELGLTDWPSGARFGYDGSASPVLRTLIQSDEAFREFFTVLPDSGKIADVPEFDRLRAKVARGMAQATRNLIDETGKLGQSAWQQRLRKAMSQRLGRELTDNESLMINSACAGLPPDLFRQIQSSWFEHSNKLSGILYRGRAFSLVLPGTEQHHPRFRLASDESLLTDVKELQNPKDLSPLDDPSDNLLKFDNEPADADSLLRPGSALDVQRPTKFTKMRGSTHVTEGGWYLDQDTLTVNYMPRGHADPLQSAWIQLLLTFGDTQPVTAHRDSLGKHREFMDNLLKQVPGNCSECHLLHGAPASIKADPSLWRSEERPVDARTFTKFDHRPHLTLPAVNDCRYCHEFSPAVKPTRFVVLGDSTLANEYRRYNAHAEEFVPMKREQCSACHRPGGANDGCTQCHNYHIGTRGLQWSSITVAP